MKRILILEDNAAAVEHLKTLIGELSVKCEVYSTHELKVAYQYILDNAVDLFIIDIILDTSKPGDASGLKFVDNLRMIEKYAFIPVLFVTSLEDSKLYAYENLHCYSFIEKPFDSKVVKKTIEKCLRFPNKECEKKTLYFRKDGIIFAVELERVVYAECINHVMHIHVDNGEILKIPYITLKKLQSEVEGYSVIQCSRNTLVNMEFVQNADFTNRVIQLKDNHGRVEIGVMFKKNMKEIFR